tara:strand:+ start:917 stop:1816 length:900 start_codon:yes stop_codon:yes gene_type:complete
LSNNKKNSPAILIDSTALVLKYWFALPPIKTSRYESIAAFMGFMNFVIKFLVENSPNKICFAFDESLGTCFRNKIYKDYKKNREIAPDELKQQFRLSRRFLSLMGLKNFASDKYEADDIIYTIAENNRVIGLSNIIITNDKDLYQIIRNNDVWWNMSNKRFTYSELKKMLTFPPDKIPDYIGLAGDRVDNIPGAPGIGDKTASRLLNRFGSLENLFEDIVKTKNDKVFTLRIKNILLENKKLIYLSKKLATLRYITNFDKSNKVILRDNPDASKIRQFLKNVGINNNRINNIDNLLKKM